MDAVMPDRLADLIEPVIFRDIHVAVGPTYVAPLNLYAVGAYDGTQVHLLSAKRAREWADDLAGREGGEIMADVIATLHDVADRVDLIANVEPVGCA